MAPTTAPLEAGEIARSLDRLERTQNEARAETAAGLVEIRERLDNRPTWAELDRVTTVLQQQITGLQDGQKWATRAIVGAFLAAVAALAWGGQIPV